MANTKTEFERIVEEVGCILTPTQEKAEEVISNIRRLVKQYVEDSGLQALVIGVSGGLDSAVVAALCQEKYIGVPLIGLSIPMSSAQEHNERAEWVGKTFCSKFSEFTAWEDQTEILFAKLETSNSVIKDAGFEISESTRRVLKGNMKSRLRTQNLYYVAGAIRGMVLGTDNFDELFCGFFTLGGDSQVDFSPIQYLSKGFEIPVIASVLGIRTDIIEQNPSDGLSVTTDVICERTGTMNSTGSDEAQLGANYEEITAISSIYSGYLPVSIAKMDQLKKRLFGLLLHGDTVGATKVAKILQRHEGQKFKGRGIVQLTRSDIGID